MSLSLCGSDNTDREGRELTRHGTTLFPAACYHDNVSEAEVPWHWHDELEAMVVESGAARVTVNGDETVVHRGEGLFINAGALHGIRPKGDDICRLCAVVFHPRLVGGSVDSIIWQKYPEPLLADPCRAFVRLAGAQWGRDASGAILDAWRAGAAESEGFEFTVRERLSALVFLLAKHCPSVKNRPSDKALRDGQRIKAMLQYIQEHYRRELTLASIAQSAAVSENECLRCFRSMMGCTPIQYVKQVRIRRAAELLKTTELKISDIGAECGFQEMSYFARSFRELKGCTPREFRRGA